MRTTEWVLIDTETSGLGMPIYCVELAGQRMRGITPDGPPFRALLDHDVSIEPQAEALHGYSRSFLRANGRTPTEVHRAFNEYAGQRPVVSYNLSFDWARVLEPELRRLGLKPAYTPGFCALTLARRCIHETVGHRLEVLRGHFFPDMEVAAHHALDDVVVTAKLLSEVIWPRLQQAGIESFPAVAAFSRKTPLKECQCRIRNPAVPAPVSSEAATMDPEQELRETLAGMLADDRVIDAEVWSFKHWLDRHEQHRTELARQCRAVVDAAFADGKLSRAELADMRVRLGTFLVGG